MRVCITSRSVAVTSLVAALAALSACSETAGETSSGASGDGGSGGAAAMMPQTVEPSAETKAVWQQISGYQGWPTFAENPTPRMSSSHMEMYVVTYHNDVVAGALAAKTLPLPDGSLIVKDNFAHEGDAMPMAVTVMAKQAGAWYWVEAMPDGLVIVDDMMDKGAALEGTSVKMCVGCHSAQSANDSVYTHDFTM